MVSKKQLLIYCGLLFIISWALQIITIICTKDFDSSIARLLLATAMVSPLFVTLGYTIKNKSLRKKILWKPNKHIFSTTSLAILIPTITAFIVLFIIQNMNYGESGWFSFSTNGVSISGGPFLLGLGQQTWLFFTANILITAIAYSLLTGLIAVGEELAWRGFLQGILMEQFGTIKGIVILGFLWSMWHLPAQLYGYNFPENQILGSFIISPIMLIAVSLFYGWLTIKSNSFIPAAIAHGAFNTIEEGVISNIILEVPMIYSIVIKLGITVVTGLVFMCLIIKSKQIAAYKVDTNSNEDN